MHPDLSLVLQKSASNLNLKHKSAILCKHFKSSQYKAMSNPLTGLNSGPDEESQDLVRIVSDEEEDEEQERLTRVERMDNEDDNISLGSELSVGRENTATGDHHELEEEDEVLDISDTHSNTSTEDMQHSPTMALNSPVETSINPFTLAHTLRFPGPFGLTTGNAAPATANISPFQEEFLRKSHIYAEELMKHQMQLMAAARASAFSLRTNNLSQPQIVPSGNLLHLNPLTKIDQLKAAAAAALTAAAAQQNKPLTPRSHHQILPPHQTTHYPYTMATDTLAKLTDLSKQHIAAKPVIPMSTLNQLQTQMQAHLPGLLPDNNDNLHERALKFSIDNILKADFGRSNSLDSPPQLRKSKHKLTNSATCTETVDYPLNQHSSPSTHPFSSSLATMCTNSNDSSSTAVSSSYGSANGAATANSIDLLKSSSPSQTPSLSPGFPNNIENNGFLSKSSTGKSEDSSTLLTSSTTTTTTATTTTSTSSSTGTGASGSGPIVWPAWVYCTRYSDRPSSGPRVRKPKTPKTNNSAVTGSASTTGSPGEKANSPSSTSSANTNEDKRPRTAFSGSQLARLKHEFNENRYLTEKRRQQLSSELGLNEAQIKIWFQNKRAKLKKSSGVKNPLALQLMAQGLYNHSTIPLTREEEELQELQEREKMNNNNTNNGLQQQPAASTVSS